MCRAGANWIDERHDIPGDFAELIAELTRLRANMLTEVTRVERRLADVHPNYRESARNHVHYLVLRRHDLRPLQMRLAELGLSSLGRAEPNVLGTLDAVLAALRCLAGRTCQPQARDTDAFHLATGQRLLAEHSTALLGTAPVGREVRIMVTMPPEAADDYTLVQELVELGMDCMRVNCAHDDAVTWSRMIDNLRRAERAVGRSCRVVMDLGGPKLRTSPLEPGPCVVRVRPRRDAFGRVTASARVWITDALAPTAPPGPADACLPVSKPWLADLDAGERIRYTDAREARRHLTVVDVTRGACWAEAAQTSYLVPVSSCAATAARHNARCARRASAHCRPPRSPSRSTRAICSSSRDARSQVDRRRATARAVIGCTVPEVFADVRAGERIWFDDGKIGGVIEKVGAEHLLVRIDRVRLGGAKLRADKGINLPDSALRLSALTQKDLDDLGFIAAHADAVELSFASSAHDVDQLQQALARSGSNRPAIVLKIETRKGFENLPDMILTAMRSPCCGVMIARGDLAVESGFERLVEVQEETLWICEAAHVPVIWATQVLETLAKEGMPSRAEITDAAMGHRAECVMLNKGPYMTTAVSVLGDILRRMHAHQAKKRAMLRHLRLAGALAADVESAVRDGSRAFV